MYGLRLMSADPPTLAAMVDDFFTDLAASPDPAAPEGSGQPRRDRRERRRGRWWKRTLIVLVAIVALVAVGAGGYVAFISQRADNNLARADLLPPDGQSTYTSKAGTKEKLVKGKESGKGETYLLLGSDARPGETNSRSDVIQLLHISQDGSRVDLVHYPRDLWVDIPGHGKGKINWAFAFGGAPLLVQTLEGLTGVQVDHVANTDFEGFKAMTDALGGVRVWADEASTASGNGGVDIKQGWNDLNGEQALGFVRERYQLSGGDLSRGQRQQAFIKAVMLKVLSPGVIANPVKFTSFVDAATKNTTVDATFSMNDVRRKALSLRGLRGDDIHFHTAPNGGVGQAGDQSIVVFDAAGNHRLAEALRADDMAAYAP